MSAPEIPMDALRRIARHEQSHGDLSAVAAYVEAVDAQADAAKDEALALAMLNATLDTPESHVKSFDALYEQSRKTWLKRARAARAHIEKERQ